MKPYGFRPRAWDFDRRDNPVAVVDKKRARREGVMESDAQRWMCLWVERMAELDSAPESDESVTAQREET